MTDIPYPNHNSPQAFDILLGLMESVVFHYLQYVSWSTHASERPQSPDLNMNASPYLGTVGLG